MNLIPGSYRAKANAYKQSVGLGRDEAVLSEEALSFSKIFSEFREAAGAANAGQPERVADIRAQLQAGTYKVDSEKIAESLLGIL